MRVYGPNCYTWGDRLTWQGLHSSRLSPDGQRIVINTTEGILHAFTRAPDGMVHWTTKEVQLPAGLAGLLTSFSEPVG
jgi:hypothetical protein